MSTASLPRTRNKEQILTWAKRQKRVSLSTAQAAALDSVYPQWRTTLDEVWFTNLEAAAAFIGDRGFFPRAGAEDPAEKALGTWVSTQRYRAALLPADRTEILNERLPGWNRSRDEAWGRRLEQACAVAARLGRVPRTTEEDVEARSVGVWLKKHSNMPATDHRITLLNERLPGWNASTRSGRWRLSLEALVAFTAAHDRFPTQHEKDREGKRLGVWLNGLRQERDSLEESRREELDNRVPGWDRTADQKWTMNLEAVAAHLVEHGKFPTEYSTEPHAAALGRWLGTQRRTAVLSPEREAALDAGLPGWRDPREFRWGATLDSLAAYKAEHGHLPSLTGHYSSAALWLRRQRKGIGMTPEREARLDEKLPGWRGTD